MVIKMKKIIIILTTIFVLIPSLVFSADVTLKWDISERATGYKIYKSLDLGITWLTPIDVGNVLTYTYTNIEENTLILFKASAYNIVGESVRTWSGAWFDNRKKPILSPSSQGIQ